jgi:hypothetical protein
MLPFVITATGR